MKKVMFKTYSYALLVTTLAVFLFSCANPVQFDATSEANTKSLYAPTLISDPNNKDVLNMKNGTTIDSAKLDRQPSVNDTLGPVTFTKIYYKGTEAIGFDFVSTKPVLAVYVKASTGGNLYSYPAPGVFGDTELYTQVNPTNHLNYGISHVDFAWATTGTPSTTTTTVAVPVDPTLYSISGFVFHDLNNNGVKDSGEAGIDGVPLSLGNNVNATSDSNGAYSFANLAAGSYTVTSMGKDNFWATPYDAPVTAKAVTLPESATGVNFGLSYESVSGFTFKDSNADGILNSGEAGIGGVALTLGGAASGNVTSGSDGSYLFNYLKGGSALYTVSASDVGGEFHTPYLAPKTSWTGNASMSGVNFGYSHEKIAGVVFYDANRNDAYDSGEPLLNGFTVRLGNDKVTTTVDGAYAFDNLIGATSYTVSADDRTGFVHSVAASRTVTPANSVPAVANFGFAVDYNWIVGKTANGFTIGYWKTNLDKAIANKTAGTQVSKANLLAYVNQLSTFALYPLNVSSMQEASNYLSATGSAPTLLLSKQLMGSEFNYASGAYIGGNALATEFFLYDGEYMLANSGSFTSAQLLAQKDKYDAYNNSHGGAVLF